jgi:hypothetical protein
MPLRIWQGVWLMVAKVSELPSYTRWKPHFVPQLCHQQTSIAQYHHVCAW